MQMSQQNQENMHTHRAQRPRSLHEVVQDPHADWSEIRQAMKSLKVCTHEGLSQIIKKSSPNPSFEPIDQESEEQQIKDPDHHNNFDPTMAAKDCIRKKSIYIFRRKSKDDLSLTLATQKREKRKSEKKERRRSSKDDISIGSLSRTSLKDLGLDEEDLDLSDSDSDTSSEDDCHFLDWAHNSKKVDDADDKSHVDDVELEKMIFSTQEMTNGAQGTNTPPPVEQLSPPREQKRGIFKRFSLDMLMMKSDSSAVEKCDSAAEKKDNSTEEMRDSSKDNKDKFNHESSEDNTTNLTSSQMDLGLSSNEDNDKDDSNFMEWGHTSKNETDTASIHSSDGSNASSLNTTDSDGAFSSSQEEVAKPQDILTDKRAAMKRVNSKDDLHLLVSQDSIRKSKLESQNKSSVDDILIKKKSSRKDFGLSDDEDDDNNDGSQFLDWAHNSRKENNSPHTEKSTAEENQFKQSPAPAKKPRPRINRHTVITHKHPSELLSLRRDTPSVARGSIEGEIKSIPFEQPPPPRNRRFKRLSMDMVKQQTNDLFHAATHRPARSRSMDMINNSDSNIDMDTIRRALLNDMAGEGREARKKQLQSLHCSRV